MSKLHKIKVICQKCGNTGEVELDKPKGIGKTWDFISEYSYCESTKENVEWVLWFCPDCQDEDGHIDLEEVFE